MNNQQAIDRLVKHLEWGWTEETVAAIEMGIHALKETQWIPISERLPEDESYILVSFKNSTMPDIARYEENGGGGTFYPGDDEKPYSSYGIFVNAWMPLPKLYREEDFLLAMGDYCREHSPEECASCKMSVDHEDPGDGTVFYGCAMFGCEYPKYAKMVKKEILKYMKERKKEK